MEPPFGFSCDKHCENCISITCISIAEQRMFFIIPGLKVVVNPLFAQFAIAMHSIRCALFKTHLITAVKQAELGKYVYR